MTKPVLGQSDIASCRKLRSERGKQQFLLPSGVSQTHSPSQIRTEFTPNIAFLLLVKSQSHDETLNLDELIKYCLMPVPPSFGTPDGFFSKINKAAILHHILEDATPEDLPYPKDALFI